MRYSILFIFLISSLSVFSQELNTDNNYFKIYEAAQKAEKNDAEGIRTLYQLSLEDLKDPMLNKLLIKTTVLGMIQMGSKAVNSYIPAVDAKFLELDPLAFLGQPPLQSKCFKCNAEGFIKFPCKDCNKGVCRNCRGQKIIVYKGLGGKVERRNCVTCEASGKCLNCDHSGIAQKGCHICYEKGSIFSPKAVPEEYAKSLKYLIEFLPKYAASKNVFITDKMVAIAKENKLKEELAEAEMMAKKKKEEELAALEAEKKAAEERKAVKETKIKEKAIIVRSSSTLEENLQHVLLEFNQFFRNRERIAKQSIYKDAEAKYVKGKPTLIIEVTGSIAGVNKSLKLQYLEAFYQFFKLRCRSNGVGSNPGYEATFNKKTIATVNEGEVVLN